MNKWIQIDLLAHKIWKYFAYMDYGTIIGRCQLYLSNTMNQIIHNRKICYSYVFITILMKKNNSFKLLSVFKLEFLDTILLRRIIINPSWRKKNDWKKKHEKFSVLFSHFNHLQMKEFKSYSCRRSYNISFPYNGRTLNIYFLTYKKPYLRYKSVYTTCGWIIEPLFSAFFGIKQFQIYRYKIVNMAFFLHDKI